jgi:hypothetical protein
MSIHFQKIRPFEIVEGNTKEKVMGMAVKDATWTYDDGLNCYINKSGDCILVNLEKWRRKVLSIDMGNNNRPMRVIGRPAKWIGYVYKVDRRLVKSVRQNARNFDLMIG